MKEIGGYLELDNLVHNEYYPNYIALNTARNALVYICRARKIKKLFIPYYLWDSVSGVCEREKIEYKYYHINADFTPSFDEKLEENEYLYIVNYFGQLTNEFISTLKSNYSNLIVDNVQAFFQKAVACVDTIYSCRKFFGVPDGAYLSTDKILDEELAIDISKDRMKHILGRYERFASEYYEDFKLNDESFIYLPLKKMSKLTKNILGAIDYDFVIKRRNENWQFLNEKLKNKNKLKLTISNAPYMYPFYCENGMEIKRKLAEKQIYIPTLWPNVLTLDGTLEKDYAENILPLPCDQRYTLEEMKELFKEIENV